MAKLALPPVAEVSIEDDGSITIREDQRKEPMLLILGDDGYYMRVKTQTYEYIHKLDDKLFNLPKVKEKVTFSLKKLPEYMLHQAHAFLRESYIKNKSETVILYYYQTGSVDSTAGEEYYEAFVPDQDVSGGAIAYEISKEEAEDFRQRGLILVGTIHSHPSFDAFQSGVDEKDEFSVDGWHITLGNVDRVVPNYDTRWCVGNKTYHTKIEEVVNFASGFKQFPKEWLDRVHKNFTPPPQKQTTIVGGTSLAPSVVQGGFRQHREIRLAVFNGDKRAKEHKCTITSLW